MFWDSMETRRSLQLGLDRNDRKKIILCQNINDYNWQDLEVVTLYFLQTDVIKNLFFFTFISALKICPNNCAYNSVLVTSWYKWNGCIYRYTPRATHFPESTIITSNVSIRGHRIGPAFLCFHMSLFPSSMAKRLRITERARCITAQVFSFQIMFRLLLEMDTWVFGPSHVICPP